MRTSQQRAAASSAVGGAGRRVLARLRAAASADGAGPSGLAALLWTHALQAAGDALIAVALAGTVFFSVPLGQARSRVALYLVLTLLPFSLLVPVAGPLLDRFRHGRRTVLAVTSGARGLIAWSMAGALASLALYPQALAVLVLTRAYGVARNAAVVRVRPPALGLVAANARLNIAATAFAAAAGAVGFGVSRTVGSPWTLRLASLVLLTAAVAALRLPGHVDEARSVAVAGPRWRLVHDAVVRRALVATVVLRVLAGLLTVFLAFELRSRGAPGPVVALVLGAAVAGQLLGTALASRLPTARTARVTGACLALPAACCLLAVLAPSAATAALAVGISGLGGSLSKYVLDAALQTQAPATSTSSAFARSETALQLGFALGGGIGVALPAVSALGFSVAAVLPVLGVAVLVRWQPAPAPANPATGPWWLEQPVTRGRSRRRWRTG